MRTNLFLQVAAVIACSLLLAACGGNAGGPSAEDLAATQQSLQSTQQAMNAQQAPTNTSEPPTAAPATTEPQAATEPPSAASEAYYTEEFSTAPQSWTYYLLHGEDADFDLYTENDRLVFDISGTDVYAYYLYDDYTYSDVRVDTTAKNLGVNNNSVSLVCRVNDRGWYEFNISSGGYYNILRYDDPSGEFTALYTGGVQNLRTGKDTNDYTIICQGNRLTLGVNGVEIRTITDNSFEDGQVGISVSSFEDRGVLVDFDYVTISQP